MRRFDEVRQHESRLDLTTDLLRQRVAVLERSVADEARPLLRRQMRHVGVRQLVPRDQLAALVLRLSVEDVQVRMEEARQQRSARPQYAIALPPYGHDVRTEAIRHRRKPHVQALVAK